MANDGRATPPGIPFRKQARLERESSLTSKHPQQWNHAPELLAQQQDCDSTDDTLATTAAATSERTGDTTRSRRSRATRADIDLDTWLASTATAVQQMHEGDAGIDGVEQQPDPMFESSYRLDSETGIRRRLSMTRTTPCSEGHACATTADSGDNNGDSTPGSSTPRPGRSNSSAKAVCGPGEEEEPQRAFGKGAGQSSGSANTSSSEASVKTAYRLGEEIPLSAYRPGAGRPPSTSSSLDVSDSASSVKTAYGPGEVVPPSAYS